MITLTYNMESVEYDAYALLTSFYPGIQTQQSIEHAAAGLRDELHIQVKEDGRVNLSFFAGEHFEKEADYAFSPEAALDVFHAAKEDSALRAWKWELKLFFYDSLSDYSGRRLPWGALTGVRPTKLIMGIQKEEGLEGEALFSYLYEHYRVSPEKAMLGTRIASLEDRILEPFRNGGYSLYVGIPFCPSTCLYCSFLSYPIAAYQKYVNEYLDCVEAELKALPAIMQGRMPDTVYIGGGTPTALSAQELDRLLSLIRSNVSMEGVREFTVEAGRPDSLDIEKLRVMKKHGVGRISVNPQTFKEDTLRLIGRHHTVRQLCEAYEMARAEGFDNINMDLILGLPGESLADVEQTLGRVREMAPDSLTVHSLALKRAAKMREWVAQHGQISGLDYERAMDMAQETAAALSMQPYYLYRQKNMAGALENTGFSREGKYGLYNIVIMEEVQSIYAIGAGTVSKKVFTDGSNRIERCDTHKDLSLYLSDIEAMIERKRKLFGEDK